MDLSTLDTVNPDDLIVLLRAVHERITAHAQTVAARISRSTQRKYPWIDQDDLQQEMLMRIPKWVAAFNDSHASRNPWSKYLYHKMYYYSKDLLRKEDPLGIGWPQKPKDKQHYPAWFRLGDDSSGVRGGDGETATLAGQACTPEMLGRVFESRRSDVGDTDDDDQWQSDLDALVRLVNSLRKRQQRKPPAPLLVDAGQGVARQSRCPHWDTAAGRVKFRQRRTESINHWRQIKRADRLQMLLFS